MTSIDDIVDQHASFKEKVAKTGWPARQVLKLEHAIAKDAAGERYTGRNPLKKAYYGSIHLLNRNQKVRTLVFDTLFVTFVIADLTHDDQQLFCDLYGKKFLTPQWITLYGSAIGLLYWAAYDNSGQKVTEIAHNAPDVAPLQAGFYVVTNALELFDRTTLAASLIRSAYALTTKKGMQALSLKGVALNAPTYIKRVREYHHEKSSSREK